LDNRVAAVAGLPQFAIFPRLASSTSESKSPRYLFSSFPPFKRTSHCHNDLQSATKDRVGGRPNTSWQPPWQETRQASCRPILLPSLAWYALILLLQWRDANRLNRLGLLSQYVRLLRLTIVRANTQLGDDLGKRRRSIRHSKVGYWDSGRWNI
jgi:hypothetical protein